MCGQSLKSKSFFYGLTVLCWIVKHDCGEVGGSGRSPAGSAATQLEARQIWRHIAQRNKQTPLVQHTTRWDHDLWWFLTVCFIPALRTLEELDNQLTKQFEPQTKLLKSPERGLGFQVQSTSWSSFLVLPIGNCKTSCVPRWFRVSCLQMLQIECTEDLGICRNQNHVFSCFRKCSGEFWEHRGCWFGGTLAGKDYHHFPTTISEVATPEGRLVGFFNAGDAYLRVQADFCCIYSYSCFNLHSLHSQIEASHHSLKDHCADSVCESLCHSRTFVQNHFDSDFTVTTVTTVASPCLAVLFRSPPLDRCL